MVLLLSFRAGLLSLQILLAIWFLYAAYEIRLYPIKEYGMIIHEFDPWFNYRATEYLAANGYDKFFKWYDYESWYPLGRPIGTTIYPGMQMMAVWIWEAHKMIPSFTMQVPSIPVLGGLANFMQAAGFRMVPSIPASVSHVPMSVNDICCMMPPWFGSVASFFVGLLTYEISRSMWAAVSAIGIMAIIPAHLMRSVGGEFDNEAVAMAAICCTFWLWIRSVRTPSSWPFGFFAGLSYIYMVAAWGGYIFVINMIGVHAAMLVGLGRFNSGVHKAYTLFFFVGTLGAMQIPVVGMTPLRSLEQMGPLLVFFGYQVLEFCDRVRRNRQMTVQEFVSFRIKVMAVLLVGLMGVAMMLYPTGYFGPLSSRIRALFVKHTKTGNPLVDSVAEHQAASSGMYASYLNLPLDYAFFGGMVCLWRRNNGVYFFFLYAAVASHFAGKMSRLVLICAPIVSIAAGIWCGWLLDHLTRPFLLVLGAKGYKADEFEAEKEGKAPASKDAQPEPKRDSKKSSKGKDKARPDTKKKKKASSREFEEWEEEERPGGMAFINKELKAIVNESMFGDDERLGYSDTLKHADNDKTMVLYRCIGSVVILFFFCFFSGVPTKVSRFVSHCDQIAQSLSNPQVVYKVRQRNGQELLVDDYYRGYLWIDENTPKDARVMAWWDYGYQITGIARRTSIADGNTWNHEHIATLGRTLTSPEKKAWNAIRHLADYVLVWAGGGGDDLAKSPHLARIGNSVFPEHCGDDDPRCNNFGFYGDRSPTPMMAKSLLYKLCSNKVQNGVKVDNRLFREVHTTKHGLMRVYEVVNVSQESKDWIADPKNKICDAPGSWYCVGQYPPALEKLISQRRNFAQLEDFNKGGSGKSAYSKLIEKEQSGKRVEM